MKIKVTQEVDVPNTPYCKNCYRLENQAKPPFCTLFNRFVSLKPNGEYLKCRECFDALYNYLDKEYIRK